MISKFKRSPFFYVGDKYKSLNNILPYFPKKIDKFIEPFAGGGSVFLNTDAREYYLNDIDVNVIKIHKLLQKYAKRQKLFFTKIENIVKQYGLSYSYKYDIIPERLKSKYKKTYYAKYNYTAYNKLKDDYNERKSVIKLYVLMIYGFNRMLRFNKKGEFNIPVGNVDFNLNVAKALEDYFSVTAEAIINWGNNNYEEFINDIDMGNDDFLYIDPPYLITASEYNKLWDIKREKKLLEKIDELSGRGIKFAISNVIEYKDSRNKVFEEWSKQYKAIKVKSNYINYHDNSIKKFKEVLVVNYEY